MVSSSQTAETTLKTAQDTLSANEATAKKTQAAVNHLNTDTATKIAALDQAKEKLANAETKLVTLQKNATTKSTELSNAQKAAKNTTAKVAQLKANLSEEQAKLDHLIKAKENLVATSIPIAKKALEEAEKALEKAKTTLEELTAKKDPAENMLEIAQAKLTELTADYHAKLTTLNTLIANRNTHDQLEAEAKRLEAKTSEKTNDVKNVEETKPSVIFTSTTAKKEARVDLKASATPMTFSTFKTSTTLPQTGEKNASGLVAMGTIMMAAAAGFVAMKSRKEEN